MSGEVADAWAKVWATTEHPGTVQARATLDAIRAEIEGEIADAENAAAIILHHEGSNSASYGRVYAFTNGVKTALAIIDRHMAADAEKPPASPEGPAGVD